MNTIIAWSIIIGIAVILFCWVLTNLLICWLHKDDDVDHLEEYFKNLHHDGE